MKFIRDSIQFFRENFKDIFIVSIVTLALAALIFFLMPVVWPAAAAVVIAGIGAAGYFLAPFVFGAFAGLSYTIGAGLYELFEFIKPFWQTTPPSISNKLSQPNLNAGQKIQKTPSWPLCLVYQKEVSQFSAKELGELITFTESPPEKKFKILSSGGGEEELKIETNETREHSP